MTKMTDARGTSASSTWSRWRVAALMPLAALAVHQLRYLAPHGPRAGERMANQGHAYLTSVTPWIVALAAIALGVLLSGVACAWDSGEGATSKRLRLGAVWATAALALILIYAGQEVLEGLFVTGHPPGLAGIFGNGGLWALPAAAGIGAALALLLRGADVLAAAVGRARRTAAQPRRSSSTSPRPTDVLLAGPPPLAAAAAERAPPQLS